MCKKFNVYSFIILVSLTMVFQANAKVNWLNLSQEEYVDKLVECKTQIDKLKWANNIWPKENNKIKPSFSNVYNKDATIQAVRKNLRKQQLLKTIFKVDLTQQMLQRDLERMALNTKDAKRLQQIFDLLNNDAKTIAECLSRPLLVKKKLEENYYWKKEIHSRVRLNAQKELNKYIQSNDADSVAGNKSVVTYRVKNEGDLISDVQQRDELVIEVDITEFNLILNKLKNKILKEEKYSFTYAEVINQTSSSVKINMFRWVKTYLSDWLKDQARDAASQLQNSKNFSLPVISNNEPFNNRSTVVGIWKDHTFPLGRKEHTAIWTGNEMIIWGGSIGGAGSTNTGSRYNPTTDNWIATDRLSAPDARVAHSAVWTGSEMIVWGGLVGFTLTNTGARYNPTNDTWSVVNSNSAPDGRFQHTVIWTGSEMIVWGGNNGSKTNTGGVYNPVTDTWVDTNINLAPTARILHTAVWTGTEMIIWGGQQDGSSSIKTGGRYNPSTMTWIATNTDTAPGTRKAHSAIWTGSEMIIWGGIGFLGNVRLDSGGRYNPVTDSWIDTNTNLGFPALSGHTVVWTGSEMIVWGAYINNNTFTNAGGRYNPTLDTWLPTSIMLAPEKRHSHTAVWTGSEMIVWGGIDDLFLETGSRYNPVSDTWNSTSIAGAPQVRSNHTSIWSGNEMIVWGGINSSQLELKSGGRYEPTTDSWLPTDMSQAPSERHHHTAIWSGSEMIIWGGEKFISGTGVSYLNTGSRYNPTTDSWLATETNLAPSNRGEHTVVWSGNEMIIWGGKEYINGFGFSNLNTGGRYNPGTNSWIETNIDLAPEARVSHTAIWSGNVMIIWGGMNGSNLNSGSRYDPIMDSWNLTTFAGAPNARRNHTATWTGTEMIIWGGRSAFFTETGGRYNPTTNIWTPTNLNQAPSGRELHTAVWTGTEIIIWGGAEGVSSSQITDTGGRYNPSLNSWLATSINLAPVGKKQHTSVWTGSDMIVWGGKNSGESNEMGIYSFKTAYFISGNIGGLVGNQATIQNNNGDDLNLTMNGSFTFDTPVIEGSDYAVTVLNNPSTPNQICTVTNGNGMNIIADVNDVNIACTTVQYDVGVTVSGLLNGTIIIQNNGIDDLTIANDGIFTFATSLDDLSSYEVTVLTNPTMPSQTCVITGGDNNNGAGMLSGEDDLSIDVTCHINQYDVNVMVTGLAATNSVSFINNGDTLTISTDDTQTISILDDESAYSVSISSQPNTPNQLCEFTNSSSGSLSGSDVVVTVECITTQYLIGGSVVNLQNTNTVTLDINNQSELLNVSTNTFIFVNPLDDGSSYTIIVSENPTSPNQTCDVSNGGGVINGADIDDILITCIDDTFFIGGNITGMHMGHPNTLILQNNNTNDLIINESGLFVFSSPILDLQSYNVTIQSQPNSPIQTCIVNTGTGNISGNDISNVQINCEFGDDLIFKNGFESL